MLKYIYTLHVKESIIENNKLRKWIRYIIIENIQINIIGKIYKESNDDYFANYLKQADKGSSEEISEYFIPLNPSSILNFKKVQ